MSLGRRHISRSELEEEDERRKRPRLADDHESKLPLATPVTYGGSSGSGLTDCRIPTEPSVETSWGGAKRVVSWADAQESDESLKRAQRKSAGARRAKPRRPQDGLT